MNKPLHPHDEVIRAWLDGKTVQSLDVAGWYDVSPAPNSVTFHAVRQYRIKPAPVVFRYRIGLLKLSVDGVPQQIFVKTCDGEKNIENSKGFKRWITPWLQAEYEQD
jgi:hypothetical protein